MFVRPAVVLFALLGLLLQPVLSSGGGGVVNLVDSEGKGNNDLVGQVFLFSEEVTDGSLVVSPFPFPESSFTVEFVTRTWRMFTSLADIMCKNGYQFGDTPFPDSIIWDL